MGWSQQHANYSSWYVASGLAVMRYDTANYQPTDSWKQRFSTAVLKKR